MIVHVQADGLSPRRQQYFPYVWSLSFITDPIARNWLDRGNGL